VRLALEPRRGHGAVAAATTDAEGVADFDGLPAATKFRVRLLSFDWAELGIREFETGEGPVCEERLVLKKGRTLTGRVTDDETGAGIAKARIGLNWTCERPVESDAEGRYVLPGWSGVNILSVVAIADGYAREEAEVGALDAIDFRLRRGFEATGRVVDGAGKPVAGALVAFVASVFDRETRKQTTSLGDATADADGRFRVGGLDPRMGHVVIVTAEGLGRARVPLEAPGAAKPVDVGDVALRPGRLLAGRFVDAEGKPLPDRWIVLAGPKSDFGPAFEGNDYGASEDLRTDDLGRFAFADVAPGAYVVRTEWDGSLECRTEVAVTADRDVLDAELRLAPTTTVEIRVVDEKGGPVQGADVMAAPASEEDSDAYPVSARTDAQGLAQLRVPWNAATLQVDSPYGVTRRYLSGGVVEWKKGDAVKPFVLREGAALQGAVVDPEGKPVARAQLRVEVSGGPWRWRDADDSGRFDLTFEKGAKVRLVFDGNVDGVENGLSGAVDCSAPQTGVVLQTSKIETDRTLLVKATSPSGGPVSGAVVAVSGFRWNSPRTATTDADGVASFDALPARALSVGARGTDAWARSAFVEATPAGQQVVVVLRKGRAMHGEVVDAEGKPAKARVSVRVGDELVGETTSDADGKFALLVPVEVVGPTGVAASGDAGYGETELPPDGAADVKVTLRK
jgi:protocatechuate 3,4-dioxygenase beta subunit